MTDLEDELRATLHARAAREWERQEHSPPAGRARSAGQLPGLLADLQRRITVARRKRLAGVATATATALASVSVLIVLWPTGTPAHRIASGPATLQSTVPLTDTSATPPGWAPVPYGDAQLSVPAAWLVESSNASGCGQTIRGMIFLAESARIPKGTGCGLAPSVVTLGPIGRVPGWVTSARPSRIINGIPVFRRLGSSGTLSYLVPQLGVRLSARGPLAGKVIGTLTRSPLSVAFAPGRASPTPRGWIQYTYGGIRVAAPASWKLQQDKTWGMQCGNGLVPDVVRLSAADRLMIISCPAPLSSTGGLEARPGVAVAVGRYAVQLAVSPGYLRCIRLHALRACIFRDGYGGTALTLAAFPASQARPTVIVIGLAGSGAVSRAIFDSIRAAN